MAKKKRKSLLQSQREKLAKQRAARRAAQRANQQTRQSTRRSLPSKGRTTAGSPRARVQRGLTRDRLAKQQLQNLGRAFQRTMKQRSAQNKLDKAAKGTRGSQTRTAGGAGQLARRGGGSSSPTSQRIQPVRVRVDAPKQLPAGKKPAGQLPTKTTQKTQPVGKASARRAQAAAKQVRAAQGSRGPNRVGQPKGAAARRYGADRVARSVRRAQVETAARRFAKGARVLGKGAARLIAGRDDGSGSALMAAMATNDAINAARGSTAKERNKPKKEQPKGKVKVQKDNTTVTRKKSRDYQAEKKAREAKAAKTSQPKKQQQTQTPKPKVKKGSGVERRLPKGKERKDRAYAAVEQLRKMRERSKQRQGKKTKKKSRANQAGWQGNRNY